MKKITNKKWEEAGIAFYPPFLEKVIPRKIIQIKGKIKK